MLKVLPALAIIGFMVWYFVLRHRGAGGQAGLHRHFGLEEGENATMYWSAEFATPIRTGDKIATAAMGLIAGALVGGVGIATARPRGVSLVLTDRQRLVMCIENQDGSTSLCAFRPTDGLEVNSMGRGNKRLQGGPTDILRLSRADGSGFVDILIHHSAQQPLLAWAATGSHAGVPGPADTPWGS
ncbi:MAG: hypothetical protein K0V04_39305 [Deltaproteobacteria bacterium]|nr:hypothetical protein [Deltaproteobacteria bacterium]